MADDKSKRGGPDARLVATGQAYEVRYFAKKHGLTSEQATKIIAKAGPSREKANSAAEKLKGR